MQQKREIKDTKRLFAKVYALVDPVLQTIPENPRFILNSGKQLRLFDEDTLTGLRNSVRQCRSLIVVIDTSGPTGIGYILTALPENREHAAIAGDELLKAWHARFPMENYLKAEEEQNRQLELHFHERQLATIDQLFDLWAWSALPEEVRQIPAVEKQLNECQDELANLTEEEDDENIQTEIKQLQEQLDAAKSIRDTLNLVDIKEKAFIHGQVTVAIAIAERKKWSELLNFDQDDPKHILNDEQFTALVSQSVDALAARNYTRLGKDELGPLTRHLAARRELQNEQRSNAEGSLRTLATMNGETHKLSLSEVRDPLDRTLFIDTITASCGKKFLDIIVGACLAADQPLPFVVKEFIEQKVETDNTYPAKAQKTYYQFCRNRLKLPPEQMEVLADFGLHCSPPSVDNAKVSTNLKKFGLLKRTRSLDDLSELDSNKLTKFPDPGTP
ncbi:hypothetical protein [Legionella hackeliae]|uniref:Uncharacterized protein n=1 Tax=Legionella hackeliae TaxID=449 RepID=A0A0A8UK60_LEGHA|nr:hypothetical protein [Legionella hackeliae]KTD12935.1 hypothetical protein Lhac_1806 [Legionella hackeliae]CEK09245.1 protein of unknown function [coiled-coil domain] [Legionella hackeliae]STX49152.1 Uncharacterised protein [Legionella hackeliae]